MNNKKVYDKYLSNIYAGSERISKVEDEYLTMFHWNKKYVVPYFIKNLKAKVLDVGCGLGQNLYTFKKLGYKNVLGVDISKESVDFCKKKGFKVVKTSAEKFLKNNKNKFDIITTYHLLEHIKKEETVGFIKMLRGSLKKNGALIINVPNGANAITGVHARYVDITHEILFTRESLKEILKLAGFTDDKIRVGEFVAYSSYDTRIIRRIIKFAILPVLTFLVDLVWYVFFVSQGATPRKNRPTLISVALKN